MSWWDRLFGRRSSSNRQTASTLSAEDQELAQKLAQLLVQELAAYKKDQVAFDRCHSEIRAIGEFLCREGGSERMTRTALFVGKLTAGRNVGVRDLELDWEGICGWRF